MSVNRALLASKIESLTNTEHAEIFRMLQRGVKQGVTYTHNQNGVFYNLNDISEEVLNEVASFVDYCVRNATLLQEYDKNLLMRKHDADSCSDKGGNKDNPDNIDNTENSQSPKEPQRESQNPTGVQSTQTRVGVYDNIIVDSAKFLQTRKKLNKPRVLAFYTKDAL